MKISKSSIISAYGEAVIYAMGKIAEQNNDVELQKKLATTTPKEAGTALIGIMKRNFDACGDTAGLTPKRD